MSRRPLAAASLVAALCVCVSAILLAGGRVGETFAFFNGETENAGSAFAGGWIDPPSSLTAGVGGADVNLSWTPAAHPPVTGQQLYLADNGTTSSCDGVTYAPLGTALAADAASAVDSGRGSTANGHWLCYRIDSTVGAWTATATFPAVRAGFFATAVAVGNGGSAQTLDDGDTFSVTFDQPPATPSSTAVCTFADPDNVVLVGDAAGCASSGDANAFALASSVTLTNSGVYTASYSVSGNTLTATIVSSPAAPDLPTTAGGTPSWTFTPSSLASATGGLGVCTEASCIPTPSGSF